MSRRYLCVCLLAITFAGVSPSVGRTQVVQRIAFWTDASVRASCAPGAIEPSEGRRRLRLPSVTPRYFAEDCRAFNEGLLRRAASEAPPAFIGNSVESELRDMGAAGVTVTAIREEVLEILGEGNACSAWYAQAEPKPAVKFASLHFRVDSGDARVVPINDAGRIYYREPYVARAQQDVGPGSIITLNAHGAFFQVVAPIDLHAGGELLFAAHPVVRRLIVGDYPGGSLKAQVTTVLHEYAHVVGLIPADAGDPGLSTQNTQTVLRRCHKEIEASPNRTIVLRFRY